jgi:hypothetical protein
MEISIAVQDTVDMIRSSVEEEVSAWNDMLYEVLNCSSRCRSE